MNEKQSGYHFHQAEYLGDSRSGPSQQSLIRAGSIIRKHRQRNEQMVQKVKRLQIFLVAAWVWNLLIMAIDNSADGSKPSVLNLSFRTWNLIDGGLNLVTTVVYAIFSEQFKKEHFATEDILQNKGPSYKYITCVVVFCLKFVWIVMGIIIFGGFDFSKTSETLFQFAFFYFVGAVYILSIGFRYAIKKGTENCLLEKYLRRHSLDQNQVLRLSQTIIDSENIKWECVQQERETPQKTKEKSFFQEEETAGAISELSQNLEILWILNFAVYAKHEPGMCGQDEVSLMGLNFTTWNLLSGLGFISFYILSLSCSGVKRAEELGLNGTGWLLPAVNGAKQLLKLGIVLWTLVGVVLLLRLPRQNCNSKLVEFTLFNFLAVLTLPFYLLFIFLRNSVRSIC